MFGFCWIGGDDLGFGGNLFGGRGVATTTLEFQVSKPPTQSSFFHFFNCCHCHCNLWRGDIFSYGSVLLSLPLHCNLDEGGYIFLRFARVFDAGTINFSSLRYHSKINRVFKTLLKKFQNFFKKTKKLSLPFLEGLGEVIPKNHKNSKPGVIELCQKITKLASRGVIKLCQSYRIFFETVITVLGG